MFVRDRVFPTQPIAVILEKTNQKTKKDVNFHILRGMANVFYFCRMKVEIFFVSCVIVCGQKTISCLCIYIFEIRLFDTYIDRSDCKDNINQPPHDIRDIEFRIIALGLS